MVLGIGCDIIEIQRLEKATGKENFLQRYFTANEITLIQKKGPLTAAGNFSAKEAVVKALGVGFGDIMPMDIEILRDDSGKPYVNLYGAAKEFFDKAGGGNVFLSISHSKSHAMASVVIEKKDGCS